jgi:hypothetical protein
MPVLWQPLLGLSRQRETTGVWTLSLGCLRVVVNEVLEKNLRGLPLRFQLQQRRIADGFGHLQPMLIHQDWTFAQFRRPISKANIRSSTAPRNQ